jgi:hypothetical protein
VPASRQEAAPSAAWGPLSRPLPVAERGATVREVGAGRSGFPRMGWLGQRIRNEWGSDRSFKLYTWK